MSDFGISFQNVVEGLIVVLLCWVVKKASERYLTAMLRLLRWLAWRERKKVKNARVDQLAIQREIVKEGALFTAFLLSVVVSLGFLVATRPGAAEEARVTYFLLFMAPVLGLEIWWLFQRELVKEILTAAAKFPARTKIRRKR